MMSKHRTSQKQFHRKEIVLPNGVVQQKIFPLSSLKTMGILFFSLTILLVLTAAATVLYELPGQWRAVQIDGNGSFFHAPSLLLTGLLFLLLCCLTGGMAFYLRNIIAPLEDIGDAVRLMSEGVLDKPILSQSGDEINRVGGRINDLAMNLQEILLYIWNHVHKNAILLDHISGQLESCQDDKMETSSSRLSADIHRMREDNEDLKTLVQSFSYFEVKLEHEKMFSDPVQEDTDAQQ